jgi:hypothetical protein
LTDRFLLITDGQQPIVIIFILYAQVNVQPNSEHRVEQDVSALVKVFSLFNVFIIETVILTIAFSADSPIVSTFQRALMNDHTVELISDGFVDYQHLWI